MCFLIHEFVFVIFKTKESNVSSVNSYYLLRACNKKYASDWFSQTGLSVACLFCSVCSINHILTACASLLQSCCNRQRLMVLNSDKHRFQQNNRQYSESINLNPHKHYFFNLKHLELCQYNDIMSHTSFF